MRKDIAMIGVAGSLLWLCGCATKDTPITYKMSNSLMAVNSRTNLAVKAATKGVIGLEVINAAKDPRDLGYTSRQNDTRDILTMNGGIGGQPTYRAKADRDVGEMVADVTTRALASAGIDARSGKKMEKSLTIMISRFEMVPTKNGNSRTEKAFGRDGLFEGTATVSQDGKELYSRKIAIQARRVKGGTGAGAEAARWVFNGQGTVNAQENEVVYSLIADLLAKYQDQLLSDTDLLSALDAAKPEKSH